jgi:hypothetical protein
MYCPQCGTESQSSQHFCRLCGANLKVIGKAVALSEAIARSDRGPLPKLKEIMESAKIKQATEDVTRTLDQMSKDISQGLTRREDTHPFWLHFKDKRTPERRREDHIAKGAVSLFSGIGLMVFLYYLSASLVLKIPPDALSQLPFEIDPLLKIIWLVGLIPALAGLGHIIAGLTIKGTRAESLGAAEHSQPSIEDGRRSQPSLVYGSNPTQSPMSIVENTTATLDQKTPVSGKR